MIRTQLRVSGIHLRIEDSKLKDILLRTTGYTEITTGPSVVLSGYTFYSGNVYLSIPEASAWDTCISQRGTIRSNIMLTLASSEVVSWRAGAKPYGPYSLNYADLNDPIPWR